MATQVLEEDLKAVERGGVGLKTGSLVKRFVCLCVLPSANLPLRIFTQLLCVFSQNCKENVIKDFLLYNKKAH